MDGNGVGERPASESESTVGRERVERSESAAMTERAAMRESAEKTERASSGESAEVKERAEGAEGAVRIERAEGGQVEPAASTPSDPSSADPPKHALGYPRIGSPSHHLWDAQQSGWPDHLPHEAWRDLVSQQRRDDQPKASSADHPAFAAGYVPNYAATPEVPSEDYVANRQGKVRR